MFLLLALPGFAGVLVNEVMYDPSGADDGLEWIELCNNGAEAVDLTGFTIESGGASFKKSFTISAGTIDPGSYFLVGSAAGDVTGSFNANLENGGASADGVRLKTTDGTVLDTLLYDGAAGGLLDDLGLASAGAPGVHEGSSLGRWNGTNDCTDTNVSSDDFVEYEAPTPRAANGDPAPVDTGGEDTGTTSTADCTTLGDLKLNELLSNPSGSDDGKEWVELYNLGTTVRDLSGWTVRGATKSTGGSDVDLPDGTMIDPGGYLLVGFGGIGSISLGNGTGGDGAYLICDDYLVDSVVYGDDNADGLFDDFGVIATSLASVPGEDITLARRLDGVDTDYSADDWTASSENSPGAKNITPQCDPTGGEDLTVNEVFYDPADPDATYEFVELYNAGTVAVNLEGFSVEAAKSSWKQNALLPRDAILQPGEFFVVGAGDVTNQDYSAASLDLGNGTSGDGVRVVDCTGVTLDTVIYGGAEGDGLTGDGGATDVVDKVSAGTSIGRYPDGSDSDQHTDWFPMEATPGEANIGPDGQDDTGDTGTNGGGGDTGTCIESNGCCGCGPDPTRPDGAECATGNLPLESSALLAAAVVAIRRRRRG